jgi:hypothetical protein
VKSQRRRPRRPLPRKLPPPAERKEAMHPCARIFARRPSSCKTNPGVLQNRPGRPAKSARASCKTRPGASQNPPGRLAKPTGARRPRGAGVTFGRILASKTLPSSGMGRFDFPGFLADLQPASLSLARKITAVACYKKRGLNNSNRRVRRFGVSCRNKLASE